MFNFLFYHATHKADPAAEGVSCSFSVVYLAKALQLKIPAFNWTQYRLFSKQGNAKGVIPYISNLFIKPSSVYSLPLNKLNFGFSRKLILCPLGA